MCIHLYVCWNIRIVETPPKKCPTFSKGKPYNVWKSLAKLSTIFTLSLLLLYDSILGKRKMFSLRLKDDYFFLDNLRVRRLFKVNILTWFYLKPLQYQTDFFLPSTYLFTFLFFNGRIFVI